MKQKYFLEFDDSLPAHIPLYLGIFRGPNVPRVILRAYQCYHHQKSRCYNRNNAKFSTYGANNIKVRYSLRDFVSWFIYTFESCGISLSEVSCGRENHSLDYCFSNIKLETKSSNSKELMARKPELSMGEQNKKSVIVTCNCCGVVMKRYESIVSVASDLQLSPQTVRNNINGIKQKTKLKNWTYSIRFA